MDENMLRMQQEAAERVRQMQQRARRFVSEEPPSAASMDIPAPPGPAWEPNGPAGRGNRIGWPFRPVPARFCPASDRIRNSFSF